MAAVGFITNAIGVTGTPESGAKLFSYVKNTTTPQAVYTNSALTTPATNPVVADSVGAFEVYLDGTKSYTLRMKTADESVVLFEIEYDLGTGLFTVVYATIPNFNAFMQAVQAALNALGPDIIAAVEQVADIDTEVVIVADAMEDVETVADNIADVQAVAANLAQLALKAPLESPALTGTPTAPTATGGTNNTQIATTAFVNAAIAGIDADITSWGLVTRAAGFDAFAATPTSANLAALVTNETGSGSLVFATSPTLTTPTLGAATATSLTLTDTGLGPIFLLVTGQSNTRERPAYSWTPPSNLRLWNWDENPANVGSAFAAPSSSIIGTGDSFAAEIARQNPTRMVYYLTIGRNGTPIANWLPSGSPDMYAAVKANVEAALVVAGVSSISGLLWWQGESDQLSSTYQTNFESLMTRWRAETWFPWRTPTVLMGVSTYISNDLSNVNGFLVDLATRDPDFRAYVHTSSLPISYWDAGAAYLHMTGAGYYSAGAMAAKALEGLGSKEGPQTHYTHPLSGDVVLRNASNQNLYHSANDKGVVIYGGNALNQGAGVSLAGGTTPAFAGLGSLVSGSTSALGWATTGVTLPTALTVVGAAATQHVVRHAASDQAIVISGGNSGTSGANIIMSGATAAIPSTGALNYGSTQVANWSSAGFAVVAPLTATTPGNAGRFTNTTDSASVQGLIIEGDRATPANNDILYMSFNLSDSAGNQEEFSRISVVANSVTNASEAAYMLFATRQGGSLVNMLRATTTVLSPHVTDGMALGSGTLMWSDLFLASGAVLNFNNGNLTATHSAGNLLVSSASASAPISVRNTTDAANNIGLIVESDRATPAANDNVTLEMRVSDSAGNQDPAVTLRALFTSVTSGAETSRLDFFTMSAGTNANRMVLSSNSLSPATNDSASLGTTSLMWSDLFLASGGVVNFNNGDVLITHSANTLAFTGASTGYTFDSAVSISGQLNHTGTSFVSASAGNDYQQVHAAADRVVGISGGTSASNGAAISMAGGSHATLAGVGSLTSGGTPALTWGATAVILPTASTILGAAGVDPVIRHAANDRAVKIYGGNAASVGAGIEMTGGAAGLPNIGGLYAGATRAMAWTSTVVVADLPFRFTPTAVASLPAAATAGAGARFFVNDATATTFASIVAGGGANTVPVYSDGTNWRIG